MDEGWIGFLCGVVLGLFVGFILGATPAGGRQQKEAIAAGVGRYVLDGNEVKFEYIKPVKE